MEYALGAGATVVADNKFTVLILVVMEYALGGIKEHTTEDDIKS